jgi:hypothetical protein
VTGEALAQLAALEAGLSSRQREIRIEAFIAALRAAETKAVVQLLPSVATRMEICEESKD